MVLVLEQITARQRKFASRKVAFIVDGKQIYLPFMAVYFANAAVMQKRVTEKLTPTSISRASKQLEEMGLLQAKNRRQKILSLGKFPRRNYFIKQRKPA